MRIDSKENIGNFPILNVRNALRRFPFSFNEEELSHSLKTTAKNAREVIDELEKRGWCEVFERGGWELTTAGLGFCSASAALPITRKKAETLLATVIGRATALEIAFPAWPVHLEKIAVFGSYLSEMDRLGDLDIALMMKRRPSLMSREYIDEAYTLAKDTGYRTGSSFDRVGGFLFLFLCQQIKKDLRSVSIHDWSDITELGCKHETVWTSKTVG
jgi:hypothetical protein